MNKNGTPQNLVIGKRLYGEPLGKTISVRLPESWYEAIDTAAGGNTQQFIREAIQEKLGRIL